MTIKEALERILTEARHLAKDCPPAPHACPACEIVHIAEEALANVTIIEEKGQTLTCPTCHHRPSCRVDEDRGECTCKCHDVADAAPDLLAACKAVRDYARDSRTGRMITGEGYAMLDDAIRKATQQ